MNLYHLQEDGHGKPSYFVLAESATAAAAAINAERRRHANERCDGLFEDGWGGDNAVQADQLSVAAPGEVLAHDND